MRSFKKRIQRTRSISGGMLSIFRNWDLYIMIFPVILYFVIFHYWPMYGVQIAFKNFMPLKGISGSSWVGFEHFIRFFRSYFFWDLIKNTLGLSLLQLIAGFPMPIILALMMNELSSLRFKKIVQTSTYAPYFISTVVMVGMLYTFLSPRVGVINKLIELMGGEAIYFMGKPEYFRTIFVMSNIWQATGWGSIIYMAALTGVPIELHEAAVIDGANRLQRISHINIPSLAPTIVILFILDAGKLMSVGFEKVLLMQNDLNISTSSIISTYVYEIGLKGAQYSFSSAIGFFNSLINCLLLFSVNYISRRLNETSLW